MHHAGMPQDGNDARGIALRTRTFDRFEDKRWPEPLQRIVWAKRRDLFAGVTATGDVFISRMSWKRVWTIRNARFDQAGISALAWKPDATALAIGTSHGKVYIHDVETSELIHIVHPTPTPTPTPTPSSPSPSSSHQSPRVTSPCNMNLPKVTTIYWVDDIKIDLDSHNNLCQRSFPSYMDYLPALSALPRPGSMLPQVGPDSQVKSETMHVLVVGDDTGQFSLNVDVAFHLGRHSVLPFKSPNLKDASIIQASLTPDLTILTLALLVTSSNTPDALSSPLAPSRKRPASPSVSPIYTTDFYIATIDTNLLHFRKQEVCALAYRSTQANALLKYLDDGITMLNTEYTNVNTLREQHINTFVRILGDHGTGTTPYDEMMTMLWVGHRSGATRQYLQHDLGERVLIKWENTVDAVYVAMKKLAVINLRPGAQRLLLFLTELYGLSRFEEHHQTIGLNMAQVQFCLKRAGHLMAALDRLMTVLQNDSANFANFAGWLRSGITEQGDAHQTNASQWDTTRIADYLNTSFQHDILGPFFNVPETSSASAAYIHNHSSTSSGSNSQSGFFYGLESLKAQDLSLLTIMADLRRVCNAISDVPAALIGSRCHLAGLAKLVGDVDPDKSVKVDMRLVPEPTGMMQYVMFQDPTSEALHEYWLIRFNAQLRNPPKGSVCGYESPSEVRWSGEAVKLFFADTDGTVTEVLDAQFYDDEGLLVFTRNPQGQKKLYMLPSYRTLPYRSLYTAGIPILPNDASLLSASAVPTTPVTLESPYVIETLDPVSAAVHKDFVSLLNSDAARIRILSVVDADDAGDEERPDGEDEVVDADAESLEVTVGETE
ncbi:hypothetical protein SeLEV6574_g01561 [Synchytrium endobioticum]|nr:hypothetical protein SeLEV6574_g01561 [Synchytrium endobioticum]